MVNYRRKDSEGFIVRWYGKARGAIQVAEKSGIRRSKDD